MKPNTGAASSISCVHIKLARLPKRAQTHSHVCTSTQTHTVTHKQAQTVYVCNLAFFHHTNVFFHHTVRYARELQASIRRSSGIINALPLKQCSRRMLAIFKSPRSVGAIFLSATHTE